MVPATKKETVHTVGRPRAFDREIALDAALKTFWENGYEASSLALLGKAMKLTPPQIYNAYKDKQNLFRLALGKYISQEIGFVDKALSPEGASQEAIKRLLFAAAKFYTRPGYPRGCLTVTGAIVASSDSKKIVEMLQSSREMTEQRIAERISLDKSSLPKRTDVADLAKFFSGVLFGMSIHARDGKSAEDLTSCAEMALRAWPLSKKKNT